MNRSADLVAEDGIDEPVLLDAAATGKGVGHHRGAEVVTAAGQVLDVGASAGDPSLDAAGDVLCCRHFRSQA